MRGHWCHAQCVSCSWLTTLKLSEFGSFCVVRNETVLLFSAVRASKKLFCWSWSFLWCLVLRKFLSLVFHKFMKPNFFFIIIWSGLWCLWWLWWLWWLWCLWWLWAAVTLKHCNSVDNIRCYSFSMNILIPFVVSGWWYNGEHCILKFHEFAVCDP